MKFFNRRVMGTPMSYDVVIVGGGINGCALARELSLRNFSVCLIEKGDFSSGTSSASSKLAHGGLRYLEQYQFSLVRESIKERSNLLENAAHLVKPLPFLFPVYQNQISSIKLRAGLFLYDCLSFGRGIKRFRWLGKNERALKNLKSIGLKGAARYYDAQMQDSRIVLENVLDANKHGADCFNYCEVMSFKKIGNKIQSCQVLDLLTHSESIISGKLFFLTVGPWTDKVISRIPGETHSPLLKPSRGIHIILKKKIVEEAVVIPNLQDGRLIFVIPWEGKTLVGTTDFPIGGDIDADKASSSEICYLLQQLTSIFEGLDLTCASISGIMSGIRPLVDQKEKDLQSVSREHRFIQIKENLISLVGGKFTTYRKIAEEAAHAVHLKFGLKESFESLTNNCPIYVRDSERSKRDAGYLAKDSEGKIPGNDSMLDDSFIIGDKRNETYLRDLSKEQKQLSETYGKSVGGIIEIMDRDRSSTLLISGTTVYRAEIIYAIQNEFCLKIMDFIRRRTTLYFDLFENERILHEVADIFQQQLNWSDEYKRRDIMEVVSQLHGEREIINKGVEQFIRDGNNE
ncbi:glycerol-3-phosphate dehydrogenase/oxidase [bacterium]|nr:glycerol-3-phosphate dehydrogenase/oxidase [bacterium]